MSTLFCLLSGLMFVELSYILIKHLKIYLITLPLKLSAFAMALTLFVIDGAMYCPVAFLMGFLSAIYWRGLSGKLQNP
ncbi:MAG: hypothetical protein NZL90_01455 [Aquificaceae bacterium]|nr:hypothetical protein [Aquificaceae bacterium]